MNVQELHQEMGNIHQTLAPTGKLKLEAPVHSNVSGTTLTVK